MTVFKQVLAPFLVGFLSISFSLGAWAAPSPVGFWHVFDDDHLSRGILKITEEGGVLRGVIVKAFPTQGQTDSDRCTRCTGARRNQPIVGMTVLWGLRQDGDHWSGGYVLNPYAGKIYRAYLRVSPDNQSLRLRGYVGVSLLGLNFDWVRVESP